MDMDNKVGTDFESGWWDGQRRARGGEIDTTVTE